MASLETRLALFLVGCIGVRTLFVVIAKKSSVERLPYLGYLALLPVLGWTWILLTGSRQTGFEAGGKIWWNDLRIVHLTNYLLFAILAIKKDKNAWMLLAFDVIIGLIAFLHHHWSNGDFKKLFKN